MRILVIDPWGVNSPAKYLNGLVYGLSKYAEISLFTNWHFEKTTNANYEVYGVFFRLSDKKQSGKLRKIIRGLEYVNGYCKILNHLKHSERYDIIHINWLLLYRIDVFLLKIIHKYCNTIVYTAHNVSPHIEGERFEHELCKIYEGVDRIILHGQGVKAEFLQRFPQYSEKLYLQFHGADINVNTDYDQMDVPENIQNEVKKYRKVYLFAGALFYNKGIDRLIPFWDDLTNDSLLIIAGKPENEYKEFYDAKENYYGNRILFLDYYVTDNVMNYLVYNSDVLLLPYRHASMSGVVFTAADFAKPILCTKTGSICEYVNDTMAFIVDNNIDAIKEAIVRIDNDFTKEELKIMGEHLRRHILDICDWKTIANKLIEECYK